MIETGSGLKRQVIECFPFFNEVDMLELHLETTQDVVDQWIIVESDHTFRNHPKEANFVLNNDRFAKFLPRIHYRLMKSRRSPNPWENEADQRDALFTYLRNLSLDNEDNLVILVDVDEIPDPKAIRQATGHGMCDLEMPLFNYYYNLRVKEAWSMPKILSGDVCKLISASAARRSRNFTHFVGGWHFSNIMTPEMYRLKHKSFSHSECDRDDLLALDKIEEAMKNKTDLFGLGKEHFNPTQVPINTLPKHIQDNQGKYAQFLLPE